MLPAQWKVRLPIMFVVHLAPPTSAMACLAFIPVTTTVLVITAMTSDTFCIQLLLVQLLRMANIALAIPVLSGEWIIRIMIVIKSGTVPARL